MNYSVLMSVYYKEKPEYFRKSIISIINQTVNTDDIVLICDGPLTDELNFVIDEMQHKLGNIINVIRLKNNIGLGAALNIGLKYCKNDFVARMDTDDISYPDRCEKEIAILRTRDIDIVSTSVEEFCYDEDNIYAVRRLPEYHKDILKFAKTRNPFNHPSVMYKKSAVEAAGGYQDFYLLEDYFLWIRMLLNGSKGYNIQEPLLKMRAGNAMYKRRSGLKYAKSQYLLFMYMKNKGIISWYEFVRSSIIRTCSSLAPNFIRERIFKRILRDK